MPDMGAIGALIASVNAVKTIAQGMIAVRDQDLLREQAVELNSKLLSVLSSAIATQAEQSALLDEVDKFKKQIAEMEDWAREKARYELADAGNGALAYAIKPDAQGAEPSHHVCANCYQQGHKSILQPEKRHPGMLSLLICNACGAELILRGLRTEHNPPPKVISGRRKPRL